MKTISLKQTRNKIASVIMATIMMFSLVFNAAPMTVYANNTAVQTFTYDGTNHDVVVSGETVYNAIKSDLEERETEELKGLSFLSKDYFAVKAKYTAAKGTLELSKGLITGSTTASDLANNLSGLSSIIGLLGGTLSVTGHNETYASANTYEVKLNVGVMSTTLAQYTISPKTLTVVADNKEISEGKDITDGYLTFKVEGVVAGEDAQVSGAPTLVAPSYSNTSVEGSFHDITLGSLNTLTAANTNYTFSSENFTKGTLTVIEREAITEDFTLPANTYNYTATNHLDAAKAKFIEDAKAALVGDNAQLHAALLVDTVVVTPSADIISAGDYTLSLDIKGEANIGEYKKYDYSFTQSVTVNKATDVKITVNSRLGTVLDTYEVYKTSEMPTAGLNAFGFYVEVPDTATNEMIQEIKGAGLRITKKSGGLFSPTSVLTVDASALNNNYVVSVTDGAILESSVIEDLIEESANGIVNGVVDPLGLPYDLGSYNKIYDGRAIANIEGEELTEFSNDILHEIIDALNGAKNSIENSGISLGDSIEIPTLNSNISLAGLNINLEKLYIDDINSVISEINAVLNKIENGASTGINTVNDLMSFIENLGTSTFALKVDASNNGLSGVTNVGETTTLTLSFEATFNISIDDLVKLSGKSIEEIIGVSIPGVLDSLLEMNISVPVSIPLTTITLGVDALPVTVYYDANETTFDSNGGLFYSVSPEILKAQLTEDYYVSVNPISYMLLTEAAKAELSADTVLTSATTHTLNQNYDVTLKSMLEDKYYGEIAKEVTDVINKLEDEISKVDPDEIQDAIKELEDASKEIEDILNGKIDSITDALEKLEGVVDGIDSSKVKELLEDYAKEALEALKDKLIEKAEQLLLDILSDPEVRQTLVEAYQFAMQAQVEINAYLNENFPLEADFGTAIKTYNGKEFQMSETGVATAILQETANVKDTISKLEITALSNIVLAEVIVENMPQDLKNTYNNVSALLEKLGVDVGAFEAKALSDINTLDTIKNLAETAVNTEIQKLNGEVEKVEAIVNTANTLSVTQLMTALENLNNECEYIEIAVTGNTANKDAGAEDLLIQVYTKIGTKFEILSLTAKLEVEPITLDVLVEDQTIDQNNAIDKTKFAILTTVLDELKAESVASVELIVDATTNTINAKIVDGVVNFVLGEVDSGDLTINIPVVNPPVVTPPATTTTTTTPTTTITLPIIPEAATPETETEIEEEEVPEADTEEVTEIEDEEVPTSAGEEEGSSLWMLILGAILGLILILFLLAKRRKEDEEETEVA